MGPLQVRQYGLPVVIPGAKPRAVLTMLGLHAGSTVSADALLELLWGDGPPRTAAKALQTHISSLRRTLGDGFVVTQGTGWTLTTTEVDASRYRAAAKMGRDAIVSGDTSRAITRFDEALALWRGIPELPDGARGLSEKTRWSEAHAALVEDRADALLATGRAAEIIGELEAAVGDAPMRERRWGQLMLALYRAGRQGEALGAYQRVRTMLADELGVDPGPDLRRLEAAIVTQDAALEVPVAQQFQSVTRAVTFLLTDIEGSTAAWETDADAMAVALARHDEIIEQVVTSRGGRLIKTRGEGDATFSVFDRPSAAAAAAIELQEAILHEPWALADPMRIRVALHTGEVELRDGDYFGRAVNRAARLRSLAAGGQILCSGATAELVIDSLSDDVILADLGMRQLKNLARPEHVFELHLETDDDSQTLTTETPMERPGLPTVLSGSGPFVGRGPELERLLSGWQTALDGGAHAVLIAGEPGVGKTRLAGEWSRHAYQQGAVVLYGRCDEDLGAPYQPFAEALRSLIPSLGAKRLRGLRGVEALLSLVPGLTDVLPDLAAPTRADPDTERYALFDAVVAVLGVASAGAPVVLVLDDLHWAAKPTLLLLRHLLRFGEHARVQIVGTYRSTDLDRSHPLAAMLADLNRDGSATRLQLSGLDQVDVSAYLAEAGYDDEELARALASVTGGNPFFLIEALRHVEESGGRWDPNTLPQGVREAVSRRLSRLPMETNKALAAAAVVGSHFALALVEGVVGEDLIDAFDEASTAGIVIEEPGGRYRFNHAIVRQSLLAELASVRRMRLHQKIAATLEAEPGADDELLAELAYHYFECAWAGNAAKAVEYCRRAADQAMARLAYEGAADLYDKAVHALEEVDEELPDRNDQQAELLIARCEALLAAGDVVSAAGAVSQLQAATRDSARLAAWGTCFDGQLSMLTDPERLDDIEAALAAAAEKLAGQDDAAGEAKAHTVRAGCLARLGRIGDAETALDHALTAARRAQDHRRVNAVLAGAPLAALWGPNPVPRAGGRCLDVVRLLRITTGSPVVEATSTRCQGVLDAFRGRAGAGRQLIDSARRSLTELGMRHGILEVDQFAGIVELVADDPESAEPLLRRAYNGFRRMGLDADTAETAALLARACLALDRDAEADELCSESERLAGHALKASIAWRTVRAQLLARAGVHDEARRVAEDAVALAGRTDLLVDHGDACLALATVLSAAGDAAGARASAERAVGLYETKGAAALLEKARNIVGMATEPGAATPPEAPQVEMDNECWRVAKRAMAAINREALEEAERLWAPDVHFESRRKIVGLTPADLPPSEWYARRVLQVGGVRVSQVVIAIRGERLALTRTAISTTDVSPGAPSDEFLRVFGIDREGRMALEVWFDLDDIYAAVAELDAAYARLEERRPRPVLENAASRADAHFNALFAAKRVDEIGEMLVEDVRIEDRRKGLRRESTDRATELAEVRALVDLGIETMALSVIAARGDLLAVVHTRAEARGSQPFNAEILRLVEVDSEGRVVACIVFDPNEIDAAITEIDARYLAGEAAPYRDTWSVIAEACASVRRGELPPIALDCVTIDHRRTAVTIASGDLIGYLRATWELDQDVLPYVELVHLLTNRGTVVTYAAQGTSPDGFQAEWREISVSIVEGDEIIRCELFGESDLDVALARFGELSQGACQLQNAATQVTERYWACFGIRSWTSMADMLAADIASDDRRRVVNGGVQIGRDAELADKRALAEVVTDTDDVTRTPIATRGERLALIRIRSSMYDTEALNVIEIDADNRIAASVVFDPDDIGAALEELDTRYLAGEAAPHEHIWSVIVQGYAAANRGELAATAPNVVNIDHRRLAMIESGELIPYLRDTFDELAHISTYLEAVHRLTDFGAVVTHVGAATSKEGFNAEWRMVNVVVVDDDLISRSEVFDETDLDAALARFGELASTAGPLDNAANQVLQRYFAHFAAREWDAMADTLADEFVHDDRRRVVNAGVRYGRAAEIANMQAFAEIGIVEITLTVLAIRGGQLVLVRDFLSVRDWFESDSAHDGISVIEINADNRISAHVLLDRDDVDAAFDVLDERYLGSEAAPWRNTWSVIASSFAAFKRHEVPTVDWPTIDRRRATPFEPSDMTPSIRTIWELTPDLSIHIETVHRLSNSGAVITHNGHGSSQEGSDAEWRAIDLLMVDDNRIVRCEIFDEVDLDAALARFDELSRPVQQLDNTANRVLQRYLSHFPTRDWDVMGEALAEDVMSDDRRHVVNRGVQHGRDSEIANVKGIAEIGCTEITTTPIAIRGERLVLSSHSFVAPDWPGLDTEVIDVVEINIENQIVAAIMFDPDDIDAAFKELDGRYLAGEAAAYASTWSVVAAGYAAFNRREFLTITPGWVNIDHRRGAAFADGDMIAYIQAAWEDSPDTKIYVAAVHRLTDLGAVVTHVAHGASREGFDAEWRDIHVMTVDGDTLSRSELFDEADLDAALARFDELSRTAPTLENAASRVYEHFWRLYSARDWDAMTEAYAKNIRTDDRRRVVNAGVQQDRDVEIANMRSLAEIEANITSTMIAIRGEHLLLTRVNSTNRDVRHGEYDAEMLVVFEVDLDDRITASVLFDVDDIDAAFAELDARYLAGEAAPYSRTWSVVSRSYAAGNRQQLGEMTSNFISVDHRRARAFIPGELSAYMDATWELAPDATIYIEAVHRLSTFGVVVTHVARGNSQQGFEAEWREINLSTVEGDMINRVELFDEADLDAALARFDELTRTAPRLENTASQVVERFVACFATRDWAAMSESLAEDMCNDDRRRLVGSGMLHGRDIDIAHMRAAAEVGATTITSTVIATRGERLELSRSRISGEDEGAEAFHTELLGIAEIDADERIVARVGFDPDDLDAAFDELDARYLAGEAATYAHTWSMVTACYASLNRRELPPTTPDLIDVDHRRIAAMAPGDLIDFVRASWDQMPDISFRVESVHRLNDRGAVVTHALHGTSRDGFEAEWREIHLMTIDGDRFNRSEFFDEADLAAALARFDELNRPAP